MLRSFLYRKEILKNEGTGCPKKGGFFFSNAYNFFVRYGIKMYKMYRVLKATDVGTFVLI